MKRRDFVRSIGSIASTGAMATPLLYAALAQGDTGTGPFGVADDRLHRDGFEDAGIVVTNDAELVAAIEAGIHARIRVAPGIYRVADMVAGRDRRTLPLTIEAFDAGSKPVFENTGQRVVGTHAVTFRNLRFVRTSADATISPNNLWVYDGGSSTPGEGCSFIALEDCDFLSPARANPMDPMPDPEYSRGMTRVFKFSQFETHSYRIERCLLVNAYQFGDLRPNGQVRVTDNRMIGWYFDGIRLIGQPDEGRVAGDKLFARNDFEDALAIYEEVDGTGSPHPDVFQGFNSGTQTNNSNPRIEDLMLYRNRSRPGVLRATNVQAGLTETRMDNVGYVENLLISKSSAHGITLSGGARGVLIERCTLASSGHNNNAWVTIRRSDGQVLVTGSIFFGNVRLGTGDGANLLGFELEDSGNVTTGPYTEVFAGTPDAQDMAELMESFTPRPAYDAAGAVNAIGEFRTLPHRPMAARAPEISSGPSSYRIERIALPTLMSDDQESLGGTKYLRFDLRHCAAGSHVWTEVADVVEGLTLPAPPGERWFQTRCVNAAGAGLWSRIALSVIE